MEGKTFKDGASIAGVSRHFSDRFQSSTAALAGMMDNVSFKNPLIIRYGPAIVIKDVRWHERFF